ncbi:MAG: FixH family protein [Pseudomonadota bacterium]
MANEVSNPQRPWREDSEPWYRQFWPWFLIALPGSVVIAGLSTLYIANRHADDLVVSDYYKDGLAINKELEKQAQAEALGISAKLLLTDERVQVRLSSAAAVEPPALSLRLSHPLEADRDFGLTLDRVAPTLYVGVLPAPAAENWHWRLEADDAAWRLDGSLAANAFLDSAPGAR